MPTYYDQLTSHSWPSHTHNGIALVGLAMRCPDVFARDVDGCARFLCIIDGTGGLGSVEAAAGE